MTKSGHFCTAYLPRLVNIVCERPLSLNFFVFKSQDRKNFCWKDSDVFLTLHFALYRFYSALFLNLGWSRIFLKYSHHFNSRNTCFLSCILYTLEVRAYNIHTYYLMHILGELTYSHLSNNRGGRNKRVGHTGQNGL